MFHSQRTTPPARARQAVMLALLGDVVVLSLLAGLLYAGRQSEGALPAAAPPATAPIVDPDVARLALLQSEVGQVATPGPPRVGVTLLSAEPAPLVSYNADQPFVLASVAKVYILTAYLDLIAQGGRRPTESDMELMQDMIRWSDNRSASTLWRRIGGPQGLAEFLAKSGKEPLWTVEEDAAWGTLAASPRQVAQFLWDLMLGKLLDPESTQIAVAFLSQVDETQRWGVSAGVAETSSIVMLKNGWYPEAEGWRLNSAGIIVSPGAQYVLAILTDSSPTMESGIELIERLATRINAYMAAGH
jgi:hypothetical protein